MVGDRAGRMVGASSRNEGVLRELLMTPKPMVWSAVNAGYHLVGSLAAALIIASWT